MHRLRELRQENKWTQKQLAYILNLKHDEISLIEAGKKELNERIIIEMIKLFNVTSDYLLGITLSRTSKDTLNIDETKVLFYYNRLSEENKDSAKGRLVDLYREQQFYVFQKYTETKPNNRQD